MCVPLTHTYVNGEGGVRKVPRLVVCCSVMQFDAVSCSVMQCDAACRSVLQHVAVGCSALRRVVLSLFGAVDAYTYRCVYVCGIPRDLYT